MLKLHTIHRLSCLAVACGMAVALPLDGARAQAQGPGWFVPGGGAPSGGTAPARPAPRAPAQRPLAPAQTPVPSPLGGGPLLAPGGQPGGEEPQQESQIPLPPVPELPALPRGVAPPNAVIGVLGVPEVMRASTAAQQTERIIGERREKLNQDAQKEQAAWRDLQQALTNQRASLTPDQIRNRERELQERITNAQRQFRDRNRIIQEAAQFALGQIERTLIAVIRQVAESRGMNLVLHRQQVALNINEFDVTDQVAEQLNKVLPSVNIPPDGVSPVAAAQTPGGQSTGGQAPAAPAPIAPAPIAPAPIAPAPTAPASAPPAGGSPAPRR